MAQRLHILPSAGMKETQASVKKPSLKLRGLRPRRLRRNSRERQAGNTFAQFFASS